VLELLEGTPRWRGLRERLRERNLRLMLDLVPNHTGLDHPWVEDHPDYYIHGTELDLARAPRNYTWIRRKQGDLLLAYGRDPYFPINEDIDADQKHPYWENHEIPVSMAPAQQKK